MDASQHINIPLPPRILPWQIHALNFVLHYKVWKYVAQKWWISDPYLL
jgi:hypothetical protein